VGLIIFSIVLAIIFIKIKFIPQTDEGQISAEIELQDGVRVDVSVKIARKIDACIIRHIPEKDMVSTTA
jgi:hydrophobic/amphiphilic exporter-1 (mainly G- bacteria), HAE1 family